MKSKVAVNTPEGIVSKSVVYVCSCGCYIDFCAIKIAFSVQVPEEIGWSLLCNCLSALTWLLGVEKNSESVSYFLKLYKYTLFILKG